jgi:hypothetical protein
VYAVSLATTRHPQSRFRREISAVMPLRLTSLVEYLSPCPHRVPSNEGARPTSGLQSSWRAAEPDDVAVGVNVSAFAFAVVLVLWADNVYARLTPVGGEFVGVVDRM